MNTNCEKCDRPECEVLPLQRAVQAYLMAPEDDSQVAADLGSRVYGATHACRLARVDWRARCLAAEAELSAMRQYMPKWRKDSAGGFTLGFSVTTLASVIDSHGLWFATVLHRRVDEPLGTRDEAMRAVEKVLRLPVCEVLP